MALVCLATLASAQQQYPTHTAFTENFGNTATNPQACYSGGTGIAAQCTQLWAVHQGSGQTIVAASSSGCSGFSGTNVIELPANATTLDVESTGTLPLLPANSGWTATITVCPLNATNDEQLMEFKAVGGATEAYIHATSSGFYSLEGTVCAGSGGTAAAHTLTVVINGSSSLFEVDGTQCGSDWTDSGDPVEHVTMFGRSDVNEFFQSIQITGATVTGSWPPSVYINFNGLAGDTVNVANMQAATICNGNAVTGGTTTGNWSQATTTGITFSYAAVATPAFPVNLSACGGSYSGASNTMYEMSVSTTTGSEGSWTNSFTTNYGTDSIGQYWEYNTAGSLGTGVGLDFLSVSPTNEYNIQIIDVNGNNTYYMRAENDSAGTSTQGTALYAQNTLYYSTFDLTPTGVNDVWNYSVNPTTGVLTFIEEIAFPSTGGYGTSPPQTFGIYLGKTGSATLSNTANILYGPTLLDYANAAAPLLPPQPSTAASFISLLGVGSK